MIEAIILKVLESVLSRFVTDAVTGGARKRQMTDVMVAVRAELERRDAFLNARLDALDWQAADSLARHNLAEVVRRTDLLRVDKQTLVVVPPASRSGAGPSVDASLKELHRSIAEYRLALGLPTSSNHEPPAEAAADLDQRWRVAINSLHGEVARERRRRGDGN